MVGVARRMKTLSELIHLKVGDGAVLFPPEVRKIHLEFAKTEDVAHTGPRVFWRNQLRRIKYHNPSISCTISRTTESESPAQLTVFFSSPSSSTPNPTPSTTPTSKHQNQSAGPVEEQYTKSEVFNIKNRGPGWILVELMKLAGGKRIEPTAEEKVLVEELKTFKKQALKDNRVSEVRNTKLRIEKEKDILKKGGLAA